MANTLVSQPDESFTLQEEISSSSRPQETRFQQVPDIDALRIHSFSPDNAATLSDQEKRRQEAINELICAEKNFTRDMEYLQDFWVKRLRTTDIIPGPRRAPFVEQVFWNLDEIMAINTRLRAALNKRQELSAAIEMIGDIYFDVVKGFEPFVRYGGHQLYGKSEFEKEKSSNPVFAQFVEETERLPESRKLNLNDYLTRPTTHLARYPLLLECILKYTTDHHPDKVFLADVVQILRKLLKRVNEESGKAEGRIKLLQLDQQLEFRKGEQVVRAEPKLFEDGGKLTALCSCYVKDLGLRDENRELVFQGTLRRRRGRGDDCDLQVFLLDHVLLIAKIKTRHGQFQAYKRPIPLELLVVAAGEENNRSPNRGPFSAIIRHNLFSKDKDKYSEDEALPLPVEYNSKTGYTITFTYLGRKGYVLALWASTDVGRTKWLEEIAKQQGVMRQKNTTFDTLTLSEGFFVGKNYVNSAVSFDHGSRIAYGTENGVYFSDLRDRSREPVQVLALQYVMQIDILEEYGLLVVLSERSVFTIPLDALDANDPTAGMKRAKKISSRTSFFKAGRCLGRTLVCLVKSSALSTTIKALEPVAQATRESNKSTLKKLLPGGNDSLKIFKEFYIPVETRSIHFLTTKLCVGSAKSLEVVDLEALETQPLLDPADPSLDFVRKRENARPIAIYRIENEFLLCYDEFAFYVDPKGCLARQECVIHWEGSPTSFALHYPFVLAFEPTFIEIRNVDTGELVQVIQGNNLRCLFADTPPSVKHSSTSHTNAYRWGNPYIYPRLAGDSFQAQRGGDAGAAGLALPNKPYTRDEIIVVSQDKIMAVRLAPPPASKQRLAATMAASEETLGNGSVISDAISSSMTAGSSTLVL
ncbi:RHO1 GDP-GTP exchange protein 2 [Tulasnella sp. 417]|nr:RHO1 GDP-GTP exchange protein 2 [Tulasnella sp. 417]